VVAVVAEELVDPGTVPEVPDLVLAWAVEAPEAAARVGVERAAEALARPERVPAAADPPYGSQAAAATAADWVQAVWAREV